jgi:hypothetical protein
LMATRSMLSTDPECWPKAPREYVFLAAAFNEVGNVLFGEAWTRDPPDTPLLDFERRVTRAPVPPPKLRAMRDELPKVPPKVTDEQRRIYRARREEEVRAGRAFAEVSDTLRRRTAAWIAERARNGDLSTYGLWTGGGVPLVQLPPSIWNCANDWDLVDACQVKTWLAMSTHRTAYYLFVTRQSLDQVLQRERGDANAERAIARRGGSKPRYAWSAFISEAVHQLDQEGDFGLDWTQTDLELRMAQWCSSSWGEEPSESSIRAKVKEARAEFLRLRLAQDK